MTAGVAVASDNPDPTSALGLGMLGTRAPAKIQEVTLMRPIHGNL